MARRAQKPKSKPKPKLKPKPKWSWETAEGSDASKTNTNIAKNDISDSNAGDSNAGDSNAGDSNAGDSNAGDSNADDRVDASALPPGYFATTWNAQMSWLPKAPAGPVAQANEKIMEAFARLDHNFDPRTGGIAPPSARGDMFDLTPTSYTLAHDKLKLSTMNAFVHNQVLLLREHFPSPPNTAEGRAMSDLKVATTELRASLSAVGARSFTIDGEELKKPDSKSSQVQPGREAATGSRDIKAWALGGKKHARPDKAEGDEEEGPVMKKEKK